MFGIRRMGVEQASRRLRQLQNVLARKASPNTVLGLCSRLCSSAEGSFARIGDVKIPIRNAKNPELVPVKYISKTTSQSTLRHLRWIMQKDLLGQDVFLIGPPGPLRRQIAMMYLIFYIYNPVCCKLVQEVLQELTKREAEYVSLSRDTTETDLKQRREIESGTAYYIDQCAVRAALEGRVLVLEGIEKAERNVLPVLNNLLENREMQLDDGRFLVAADRYDKLLQEHSKEELDALKLVRVNENFRVIALGLPIPRYQGNPLDPPLRSRFQARDIHSPPFKEQLEELQEIASSLPSDKLPRILSFASTLQTSESTSLGLPDFPMDNVTSVAEILDVMPDVSEGQLLHRLYPHDVFLGKEGKTAVEDTLAKFEIKDHRFSTEMKGVSKEGSEAMVHLSHGRKAYNYKVLAGNLQSSKPENFVMTDYHRSFLADILQSHIAKDFCIIGPRGCGKSVTVQQFAGLLGYHVEQIMLYQDMTSRDLLQQRTTLPNGDTIWRPSPLVTAAVEGSLAVLDGVHRINPGSFSVLHRLIHERELQLFDGTRLVRQDRYDQIKDDSSFTDEDLAFRKIFPIHPSFRIVALAEPPVPGSSKQQWLSPELLTMFLYHHMRQLSRTEELEVIETMVKGGSDLRKLFDFVNQLRESHDSTMQSIATSLSTRQLLRIAKRLAEFPSEDLYSVIQKACLARFLPRLARTALEQAMEKSDIKPVIQSTLSDNYDRAVTCEVKEGMLRIGNTTVPVYNPLNRTKVPDILFYENPQHLSIMEDMLKDFSLGEHLLLVGNQGVGKNKIIDRFLYLLNRPREYLQLHRDTTVQTLTLQPTVRDGVIIYEDSPLVRAVKLGHVLVVDEADKAPTHVTCILKTLVESGEMHLADGRRIVSATTSIPKSDNVIVSHPDFKMMVLANRPGFPFLGNDFFGAMGDIFSCHAIDNPDMESEMSMLRQYGPDVPETTLRKLVLAFGDLRDMADQGLISYPYSTREVVNMVKHIQKFPNEGLTSVVRNVFDFDNYNKELQETIIQSMQKHGIPLGATEASVRLAQEFPLPKFESWGQWTLGSGKTKSRVLPVEARKTNIKGPVALYIETQQLDRAEARADAFTEQEAYWNVPMHEANIICDIAITKAENRSPGQGRTDIIHIATSNPVMIYSMNPKTNSINSVDLYDIFPVTSGSFKPRVKLIPLSAPLDDQVVLHEEVTNIVLVVNVENGEVQRLYSPSMPESKVEKRRFPTITQSVKKPFRYCPGSGQDSFGTVVFYQDNGDIIEVLSVLEGLSASVTVPFNIKSVHQVSANKWLVTDSNKNQKYMMERKHIDEFVLLPIQAEDEIKSIQLSSQTPLSDNVLSKVLGEDISSPNRVLVTPNSYASILVGFPDLISSEVYACLREPLPEHNPSNKDQHANLITKPAAPNPRASVCFLPDCGQIIRALPTWKVPDEVFPDGNRPSYLSGYLEVSDIASHRVRYIPVPGTSRVSPYASWLLSVSDVNIFMSPMSNDGLATVDAGGCVRLWETSPVSLERSLREWRTMIGFEDGKALQMTIEKESDQDPEAADPKHGKEDPGNAPHVGGNTWAGGTGGSGTAGLGGFGGPYRLDAGHDVYQVPDAQKDAVPEHVRQAARQMAEKAFKERLREIQMSEYDAETYEKFAGGVRRQVQSLRVILDSLQAKGKERQWLKNQPYGDLDDARLIEGLTGEKAIYKKRGEKEPEMGSPQELPKLLRLLVDVSGSMYRFNGYDGRLEREMESALMVMEAFENYEEKFKYDIYGHSGEDHKTEMLSSEKLPKNNKDRLVVLQTMHAHSQFCLSGDNTFEATKHAIESIGEKEADERFVIVLSDANFERYGLSPKRFGEILMSNDDVNAYAIFIGSLGDQAVRLTKQLPMGRAFICLDTKNLPQILQQIFTSTMLSSN